MHFLPFDCATFPISQCAKISVRAHGSIFRLSRMIHFSWNTKRSYIFSAPHVCDTLFVFAARRALSDNVIRLTFLTWTNELSRDRFIASRVPFSVSRRLHSRIANTNRNLLNFFHITLGRARRRWFDRRVIDSHKYAFVPLSLPESDAFSPRFALSPRLSTQSSPHPKQYHSTWTWHQVSRIFRTTRDRVREPVSRIPGSARIRP